MIENRGPEIVATNYWETELAGRGYLYLSINAGAFRLLIPPILVSALADMRAAQYVIVTRGTWYADGTYPRRDALELLFEDGSDAPYVVHIVREQYDRLPVAEDEGRTDLRFLLYSEGLNLEFDLPARYRRVKRLPCLNPWET